MRHHLFRGPAGEDRAELADELILAERPSIGLEDPLLDLDAGVLANDRAELAGVVLLDEDEPLGLREVRRDVVHRERLHQPDLEEVHLLALFREDRDRVLDRALRRTPAHDRQIGIRRPPELAALVGGDGLEQQGKLAHALVHHRGAHLDALGDVPVGVVLVRGAPEAAALHARPRARRDAIRGEGVTEVLLHVSVTVPVAVRVRPDEAFAVLRDRRPLAAGERLAWPLARTVIYRRCKAVALSLRH